MSEVYCCVSVEDETAHEIKNIADFPLRIHNIGMCQMLAHALHSPEFYHLTIRNGVKIPLRVFSLANLKDRRVNGWALSDQTYNAITELKGFIAKNRGHRVKIYAHWTYDYEILREIA